MDASKHLKELFEFEYCDECGGDAEHHELMVNFPFPGTHFAACRFPRDDEGALHPVVETFRGRE